MFGKEFWCPRLKTWFLASPRFAIFPIKVGVEKVWLIKYYSLYKQITDPHADFHSTGLKWSFQFRVLNWELMTRERYENHDT